MAKRLQSPCTSTAGICVRYTKRHDQGFPGHAPRAVWLSGCTGSPGHDALIEVVQADCRRSPLDQARQRLGRLPDVNMAEPPGVDAYPRRSVNETEKPVSGQSLLNQKQKRRPDRDVAFTIMNFLPQHEPTPSEP